MHTLGIVKKIIILLLSTGLISCGFKLKGQYNIAKLKNHYIYTLGYINDPFNKQLANILHEKNIKLHDRPFPGKGKSAAKSSTAIKRDLYNNVYIEIGVPLINQNIQGYDAKGQISQYKITINCEYKIFDLTGKRLQKNVINKDRIYTIEPNQLLSSFNEQQQVIQELNLEVISLLLKALTYDLENLAQSPKIDG